MPVASSRNRLAGVLLRTQPDVRLVALAREGHEAAQEEIVRRYRAPLVAFAAGIVPSHRSEDVVQESLAKAFEALRTSGADIALRPWLYTIVRNRALNDLRDERVHDPIDESIDGVPQPPDVAARRAEFAATVAAIKDLPEAQRQALVQREMEGRSHDEIAASLGASPGAVRQLIFRARTALRDAAGFLVPLPLVRYVVAGGSAGTAVAAGGGGGGIALKAGTALVVGSLLVGSGIVFENRAAGPDSEASAAPPRNESGHESPSAATTARQNAHGAPTDRVGEGSGSDDPGDDRGESSGGDNSGPGSGSAGPSASSGPGGDGDDDGDTRDEHSGDSGDDEGSSEDGSSNDGSGGGGSSDVEDRSSGSGGGSDDGTSSDSSDLRSGDSGLGDSGSGEETVTQLESSDSS